MYYHLNDDQLALGFKALAHPTRVKVFRAIYNSRNGLACSDLCESMDIDPASMAHHLGLLKRGGLVVEREVQGKKHLCGIDPDQRRKLKRFLNGSV